MESYKDQIFGITYTELKEMLQKNYESSISSIRYEDTGRHVSMPGLCGDYDIPKIELVFYDGMVRMLTLFARKQLKSCESKQAHHYQYLTRLGLPVPYFYGSTNDSMGCEIMLLNYEHEIVDEKVFFTSEENIKKFIDLAARLSCIRPPLAYLALIGRDMADKNDTRDWKTWMPWAVYVLDHVWDLARKGCLNKDLEKLCQSNEIKTDLQSNALILLQHINCLEVGLSHSDFRPNNMVWLNEGTRLGLIDFEDLILDAKHYDISRYLGAPAPLFKWDEGLRKDYLDYFIQRNDFFGGKEISLHELKNELFQIWYARALNLWEWLPNEFGGPGYDFIPAGKNKAERCDNLYEQLATLVENRKAILQSLST